MDHDVIILGGGPAGLAAAIYTSRAQLRTLLLEKEIPGGQLNKTTDVENYPGFEEGIQGPELMLRMRNQAERFGTEIEQEEVVDVELDSFEKVVITDVGRHTAPCIIVATGAGPIELLAKGAREFTGKGLSYCATCDGYFFQGAKLLEIGAGDSGFTEALFLTRFADELRIVVRHSQDDPHAFRAKDGLLREKVMNHEKIGFIWNAEVVEIKGDGHVSSVVLRNLETGEEFEEPVGGVFVNIGHAPATAFLNGKVEMNERGYLLTDERMRTNIPGMYAAGDARALAGEYAQAVIAAGDGCIAALEVEKYIEDHHDRLAS
ncbi:MAG: NAD(P)/FAD-dependent oxidoreductase [Candidatus Bipolaricaulia bacterium]